MASIKDSFANLEKHIEQLQENVEKFSNALNHWQQWKEEYETLREDVRSLPQAATREDLARTREGFEGELIKDKELIDIFGKNDSKKPDQIKSILTNRLDYVTKNIQTLQKQLETAENKLAAANVVSNPDAATDDDGLPITEIMEELDDDDNVVSYSLRTPGGGNQKQLLEALEKLGIKEEDIPEGGPDSSDEVRNGGDPSKTKDTQSTQTLPAETIAPPAPAPAPIPAPAPAAQAAPSSTPSKESQESKTQERAKPKTMCKKRVAFAEDTKSEEEAEEGETEASKRLVEILRKARDEQGIIEDPVMPADEAPEDAALREDMIRYNKETMEYEMAPIVAELNLEEGSEFDSDDYSDYDNEDEDEDENEDQWGRSTKSVVDDDWKLQMLELKERLSQQNTFGAKKTADGNGGDESDDGEGLGRITIKHKEPPSLDQTVEEVKASEAVTPSSSKKGVRFAQSVDIAEESVAAKPSPSLAPASSQTNPTKKPVVDPLSDVVMERSSRTGAEPTPKSSSGKKPTSRFRKERANNNNNNTPTFQGLPIIPDTPVAATDHQHQHQHQPNTAPSGPQGRTLSTSILEHEPSMEAKEPDGFDASLVQQQVSEEYHKMRNRFVYRQGGFLKEDERPVRPLDEEEGGPRRVSRFRAARLAGSNP